MPLASALIGTAWGWSPAELRPLDPGPALAVAGSSAWDGAPVLLVGAADGTRLVDVATGATLASAAEPASPRLLVQDLDGSGEAEVLACSVAGIHLLRGHRGSVAAARPLSDAPCTAVVAEVRADGSRLVSAGAGTLTRWEPTSLGLDRIDLGVAPAEPVRLAASGGAVATVLAGEVPWTSDGGAGDSPGPIVAVAGLPPADGAPSFAWLVGGERPRIVRSGREDVPLRRPASGLAASGGVLWVLDADGGTVGAVGDRWVDFWTVPVVPRLATAFDADGDGCPDLLVADGAGAGALAIGRCEAGAVEGLAPPKPGAPVAPVARVIVPTAPAEVPIGERWAVVDVRVGDVLRTKLVNGTDGRWRTRRGPPGFGVQADGSIEWKPDAEEVGRWRVSIRASRPDRLSPRWSGLELRVWPAESTVAGPVVPDRQVAQPDYPHRPSLLKLLAPRTTLLGLGAAGGGANAGGTTWQSIGGPETRGGVSPMASLVATWGSPAAQAVVGVDTAPFFAYGSQPEDRRHVLATMLGGQLGAAGAFVGVYGTYGYSIRGLGLRAQWTGLEDWRGHPMGFEARGLWLAPQAGAAGSLAWVWTL